MVWGGGWIFKAGAIDFAGGLVVHMSSGFSALVAALMVGKRRGFGKEPMPPHSLPLCLIGAGLLWVGWFGFNAGSALSREPARGAGLPEHEHGDLDRGDDLGGDRVDAPRQADGARRGDRGGRGPRRDHARLRQRRRPMGSIAVGVGVVGDLLRGGHLPEADRSATTTRSTRSASTGSAAPGARWRRVSSRDLRRSGRRRSTSNAQQVMVQLKGIGFTAVFAPADVVRASCSR